MGRSRSTKRYNIVEGAGGPIRIFLAAIADSHSVCLHGYAFGVDVNDLPAASAESRFMTQLAPRPARAGGATCRRPVTAMRRVGRDGRTLTVEAIPLTALRLTATVRLYAEEEKHQKWAHAFLNRR